MKNMVLDAGVVVILGFAFVGMATVTSLVLAALVDKRHERQILEQREKRRAWANTLREAGGQPSLDGLWVVPGGKGGKRPPHL